MIARTARQRSLHVYHMHMDGPDADALEWRALFSPRFAQKLRQMGVTHVSSASEADVVVVTGLLTNGNLDTVLSELAGLASPSVVIAAGDAAINGGVWSRMGMPTLSRHTLSYYVDIQVLVAGNPPIPDALIEGLAKAAEILGSEQ